MNYLLFAADLSLFEGEGGGDSAAAENSGENENTAITGRRQKGEYANVRFGKQADDSASESDTGAADQTESKGTSKEDRMKSFKDLINGEYKDLYTEETQKIIDKRFKQTKELEASAEKSRGLFEALASKYGVDATDIEAITNAVNNDNYMWEEQAEEAGMTVEQYKQYKQLERDSAELKRQEAARTNQERAERQLAEWNNQAEELKKTFPGFDLNAEANDPQFLSLLRAGVPVDQAYKVIHMDDIVSQAMTETARAAEKRTVDNVRARGSRPQENGAAARSAFTVKDDVSKLTKADRAEIARRAARGDRISF